MTFTRVTVFAIDHVAANTPPSVLSDMVACMQIQGATLSVRRWVSWAQRGTRVYRVKLTAPWVGPVFLVFTDQAA